MIHQDSPKDVAMPVERRHSPKRPWVKTQHSSGGSMNGPLYMQTPKTVLVRRIKRNDEGPWKQVSRWFVENQVAFSFNLISLLFLAHASIPKARHHTVKFFTLSYHSPGTGTYGMGYDDVYLLSFCIVLFTGLRAACMEYVLAPYAKWRGLRRKEVTRFSEQAWMVIYYTVFWVIGLYIYLQSPYWMNLGELWTNWPAREISGLMKGYMLLQWAFWLQQVVVINIEDRRKDFWQMLSHHFITIGLIHACYSYHHTRVGNLILVIMDVVDILLPLAKCLKYLGHTILCDFAFATFMVVWFFTRHIAYMLVVYSIYNDTGAIIGNVCYRGLAENLEGPIAQPDGFLHYLEPFHAPEGVVCWNDFVRWCFLSALLMLQALTIGWFILIINVAIKVIKGSSAEDVRSDDEGAPAGAEAEMATMLEEEFEYEEAEAVEQEVGVEDIDLHAWERRSGVKKPAPSSTGVSLPGQSDRKELLGRIGCEKQVD